MRLGKNLDTIKRNKPYLVKMRLMCFFVWVCVSFIFSPCTHAASDGFKPERKIDSEYFSIYMQEGINEAMLALKIYSPSMLRALVSDYTDLPETHKLADEFDTLFLVVSEILDIRLKKYSGTIKVCKNAEELRAISRTLFGSEMNVPAFYVVANNTIYIDAENVTIHILGHELSHAIQCEYFVVPPSVKIQEVLSGYVEYQLRKYANNPV